MNIQKTRKEQELLLKLEGRLDANTAPLLEAVVNEELTEVTALRVDFTELEYLSSAGLRVLLSAQKIMSKQGKMVIFGVNEGIEEIFELTGFSQILTIEK